MADITLTQAEADALMAMDKSPTEDRDWQFPEPGAKLVIPLISADKSESFMLDITRGRIKLTQVSYLSRARQSVVLVRLDLDGPPHRKHLKLPDDFLGNVQKFLQTPPSLKKGKRKKAMTKRRAKRA